MQAKILASVCFLVLSATLFQTGQVHAGLYELLNTTASNAGSTLSITGLESHARHSHGGEAASLESARFQITYTGEAPLDLTVARVEYLVGHSCQQAPTEVASEPTFGGLTVDDQPKVRQQIRLVAGESILQVYFSSVSAYYTYCDRFAFRVTFQAGDENLVVTAETSVVRITVH